MTINVLPPHNIATSIFGYLLHALDVAGDCGSIVEAILPDTTIYVAQRGAVLSMTTVAAPLFRDAVASLATDLRLDIILVRIMDVDTNFVRTTVDLNLGLLPGASPWPMNDLEPWTAHDGALWLVPTSFGPAVSVSSDGFMLELVPPYHTTAQRTAGILRAASDLGTLVSAFAAEARR